MTIKSLDKPNQYMTGGKAITPVPKARRRTNGRRAGLVGGGISALVLTSTFNLINLLSPQNPTINPTPTTYNLPKIYVTPTTEPNRATCISDGAWGPFIRCEDYRFKPDQ